MAALEVDNIPQPLSPDQLPIAVSLTSAVADLSLKNDTSQPDQSPPAKRIMSTSHPRIYTRAQLLRLHNSPLVQGPPNMPELKDWFGTENEQNLHKKDSEPLSPNNARDRRFRRDVEDADSLGRPSFRSAQSQPSQMGNFKHHSLRTSERDRERDGDRDKDGQERLRNLSEKYDRDRLGLSSASQRNKERDPQAILASGSTGRLGTQSAVSSSASRRVDARENAKRKAGEAREDWRRGSEPRSARDERFDPNRKDRDDRERPRSRLRDSSKNRRDPSTSRREREKERDRDDRDRTRNDHLDRDDGRRGRDNDKGTEADDPRRWRDDGKRDERIAGRRERGADKEYRDKDRVKDKTSQESGWDNSSDKRWTGTEERDGRPKRASGRDRKQGPYSDDRDDRKEREREKEPAWMETYVPSPTASASLDGKLAEGELDGIQAWKKGMKEKEQKEKTTDSVAEAGDSNTRQILPNLLTSANKVDEQQLDEIQLFRLLMKREEEKKRNETSKDVIPKDEQPAPAVTATPGSDSTEAPRLTPQPTISPVGESSSAAKPINSLLSLLGPKEPIAASISAPSHPNEPRIPPLSANSERPYQDQTSPPFNPPAGSRLLAFAKTSSAIARPPSTGLQAVQSFPRASQQSELATQHGLIKSHSPTGFSPFDDLRKQETTLAQEYPPDSGAPYPSGKGSRFAKFFEGKAKEGQAPFAKGQTLPSDSSSPVPSMRHESTTYNGALGNHADQRTVEDLYAMLNNSIQRGGQGYLPAAMPHVPSPSYSHHPQSGLHPTQLQPPQATRLESLYDSRLDDRNFTPDGMVPGLRPAIPPRRDNVPAYSENVDDNLSFNIQRLQSQQPPRNLDPLLSNLSAPLYGQQPGRSPNISLQQHPFRGGPSPIPNQSNMQTPQLPQRLPPGLANLGGRPPHEPSQFMGMPGVPSPGLHPSININGSPHQLYNSFVPTNNLGYGSSPQMRVPPQFPSPVTHHPMGGLGHPNNLEFRPPNQGQILGLGGVGSNSLRNGGGFGGQQGAGPQIQGAPVTLRQQQQQLPPQMLPHVLPPHPSQPGLNHNGPSSQPAHDLMALLMGGSHRE